MSLLAFGVGASEPAPAMKVIASRLRCSSSSLTFLADRLLEHGYVERSEDPQDRRSRVLSLTPAGIEVREKVATILQASSPIARLSDEERDLLCSLLVRSLSS